LNRSFPYYVERLSKKQKIKTACRLAARKLIHEALSLRKMHAGKLLKQVRSINSLEINNAQDFGGDDPVASRPQWIVATTRDKSPLHIDAVSLTPALLLFVYPILQLTKEMDEHVSMDVQRISDHKLIVAVSSHKK